MRKLLAVALILVLVPFAAMEAQAPQHKPTTQLGKAWYGQASWYGKHWDGRRTACGKVFDSQRLYAAHPSLPCGTWVRITNTRTQHSAFAKIVDRGPYEEGREIDVAEAVANRIDIKGWGVERVKIEVVREVK